MKKLLLICSIFLFGNSFVNAQTTEDFETETPGSMSFTDNGQNFSIANGGTDFSYDIEPFAGGGWNGTAPDNQFIDNSTGIIENDGSSFTISTTDGTDIHVNSLYIFITRKNLTPATSTAVTITGKKNGSTVYTIFKNAGFSNTTTFTPNNGFTLIDFSTEGGFDNSNTPVDEIVFTTTGNADYMALDALNWEFAPVCTDPTIPTITQSPATVCVGGTASLNISGTLNDATAWHVYTGSCGGTSIGSTATGTFFIPGTINTPTTYFVRGEGGCVTPGSCGQITITPQAADDASFSYSASAYCTNASDPTPTITGLGGGGFSSAPGGLSLNPGTGLVDVSTSTPGTYTVTYTTTGSCPNSSNVSVTINATDDASFSYSAGSYCVNDADPTSTITGLAGGGFTSTPGLTLNPGTGLIDVSTSTPGAYTVTYTTTGTCPNSSNVAVTINAIDDASFSYSAGSYCVNDADPTPTVTGLGGGGFTSAPGLTLNPGTGLIDVSTSTPGTYTVTYTTTGTCPNSSNVAVTINGADDASFSYSASGYCVNDPDPTPTITGLTGGGFTSSPAGLSINSGTGAIDVSTSTPNAYAVTYTTTGSCPSFTVENVTVNALDDASFSYSAGSYCVNDADPTPTVTGLGGGGFTSTPGLTLNPGTGLIDVSTSTPGTYTVTYTTTGTCPNSSNVAVTINGLAGVTFTALADLCINAGVQAGLGGGSPTGGIYSGTGVTDDGNGMTYSFDPAAAGVGVHTITYTISGACTSSASDAVEVFGLPTVTFTALADLCINAGVQTGLGGGSPTGGVYSGTGITDDGNGMTYSFDPAAAGVGTHTITYTFTNANGCTGSASDAVEVFGLPTVTFTALADLCIDAGVQVGLGGGSPTGGVYSGTGITDDGNGMTYSFDPASAGVGTHTITYTFTNANGCTGSASDAVEVFGLPTVTFTALADLCIDAGVQAGIGGGSPTGGVYSGTGITDDGNGMTYSFDPAAAGLGVHTITYTFTNANGCSGSANDNVEVIILDDASFMYATNNYCADDPIQIQTPLITGVAGGTFSSTPAGLILTPGTGDIDLGASTPNTYTVTYTTSGACPNSSNAILTIHPQLTGSVTTTICNNDSVVVNGTVYNAANPSGTEVFSGIGPNNCDSTVTINLNVLAALTGVQNETVCDGGSIVVNGTTYDAGNLTGTEVFTNVGPNNCDSTVTVTLTIEPAIDATVDNTLMPMLTANQAGATYQWVDCDNGNAPIPLATSQSYTATLNGNYAVEVTVGSCMVTSGCEAVTGVGIRETSSSVVSVYPNPTSGLFTISLTNTKEAVSYMVTTLEGRIVKQANNVTLNNIEVDLTDESKGIYFLRITEGNSNSTYKIVRQ